MQKSFLAILVIAILVPTAKAAGEDTLVVRVDGNSAKLTVTFDDGSSITVPVVLSSKISGWSLGPKTELDLAWMSGNYFRASGRLWRAYGPQASEKPSRICVRLFYLETCSGVKIPCCVSERILAVDPPNLPR